MLKIFQNIRQLSAIWVLLIGIALRLPVVLLDEVPVNHDVATPVSQITQLIGGNLIWSVLAGLVVVFIQAMLLNRLCIQHDVIYSHTYLPAYFYMVLSSLFAENLLLNPVMIVNLLVIFAFFSLFQLYQNQESSAMLFYSSLFFGMCGLIVSEFMLGVFFLIAATIVFKNVTFRDVIGIVTGAIFPIWILFGIYYIIGVPFTLPELSYKLNLQFSNIIAARFSMGVLAVITVAGLFKTAANYNKNNIKTRRINMSLIVYFAFALLLVLLRIDEFRIIYPVLAINLSVITAYFMLGSQGRRWKELINYLLLIAVFFSLYGDKILAVFYK